MPAFRPTAILAQSGRAAGRIRAAMGIDAQEPLSVRGLRWITVVAPVVFLGLLDYVRHEVAPGTLHTAGGFVAAMALVTAAAAVFSHLVFGAIARMRRKIEDQTTRLEELYAESQRRGADLDRLINSSGDAIITTDADGQIRTWSNGAEAIYGFTHAEAVGQRIPMVPPDRAEEARLIIERVMRGETVTNFETERQHRSGRRLAVMVTVSPVLGPQGEPIGIMGVSKDLTDKRRLELQERRLALLEERERIAMDLHDGAIQSLYAVGLRLEAAARLAELSAAAPNGSGIGAPAGAGSASENVRPLLGQAVDELNRVIQEIRDYVRGLGPRELAARGLVDGLETLLADLRDTALVAGHLAVAADAAVRVEQLDAARVGQLLQMAREALSNAARHARARAVKIELAAAGTPNAPGLRLTVCDDGRGFDVQHPAAIGRGLRNLRERAAALGGHATFVSAPGAGTAVIVSVPVGSSLPRSATDDEPARLSADGKDERLAAYARAAEPVRA